MDEFTIDQRSSPRIGDEFDVEISAYLLEDGESWDVMFAGNPDKIKSLDRVGGWCYRAYGEVVSIDPVVVDCGMLQIPDVFHSTDSRVIGEFIAFTIARLEARRCSKAEAAR